MIEESNAVHTGDKGCMLSIDHDHISRLNRARHEALCYEIAPMKHDRKGCVRKNNLPRLYSFSRSNEQSSPGTFDFLYA
jgi:hypothetical protein